MARCLPVLGCASESQYVALVDVLGLMLNQRFC